MKIQYSTNPDQYSRMNTDELRETYLVDELFQKDEINLNYYFVDRTIIGTAVPDKKSLQLTAPQKLLAAEYFTERRELGVFNIGGDGTISVDGTDHELSKTELLYIGRGNKNIEFKNSGSGDAPRFYFVSFPAHHDYPTKKGTQDQANLVQLGSPEGASERNLYQYVHPDGIQSSQLVMGYTRVEANSVWNTMPAHTHMRRCEVYLYFDLEGDNVVFHMMGPEDELRTIVVRNEQAVFSPPWSIHGGAGTSNYCFIWAMGGENQSFSDMDPVKLSDMK
mgnify:CR=1 FL=1